MKIGLVRHFEVIRGYPVGGWLTQDTFNQWMREYDESDVRIGAADLGGIAWDRCYSSDLPRALKTAAVLHAGPIVTTDRLREPAIRPFFTTSRVGLPFWTWTLMLRLAWLTSHPSQAEVKRAFLANVQGMADELLSHADGNTLVVGHAGFMIFLRRELLRRGLTGPRFRLPENGRLYVFERR
ncbi:MAG TPA: histidine phosphatase family protein [Azospirillum sp.]